MKNSIIFVIFCLLLFIFGCGDGGNSGKTADNGNDSGRETGSLYGECYPNETCDKGLECDAENNICIKKSDENNDISNTQSEQNDNNVDADSMDSISDDNDSTDNSDSVPDDNNSSEAESSENSDSEDDSGEMICDQCKPYSHKCQYDPKTDSYSSYYCGDNTFLWNLFEYCPGGCDDKTGKCKIWKDPETNLTWSPKQTSIFSVTYEEAKQYCSDLSAGGFDDWRMPNIDEMRTLALNCSNIEPGGSCRISDKTHCLSYDDCYISEACICSDESNSDQKHSKFYDSNEWWWSSSVIPDYSGVVWGINFYQYIYSNNKSSYAGKIGNLYIENEMRDGSYSVRCVR